MKRTSAHINPIQLSFIDAELKALMWMGISPTCHRVLHFIPSIAWYQVQMSLNKSKIHRIYYVLLQVYWNCWSPYLGVLNLPRNGTKCVPGRERLISSTTSLSHIWWYNETEDTFLHADSEVASCNGMRAEGWLRVHAWPTRKIVKKWEYCVFPRFLNVLTKSAAKWVRHRRQMRDFCGEIISSACQTAAWDLTWLFELERRTHTHKKKEREISAQSRLSLGGGERRRPWRQHSWRWRVGVCGARTETRWWRWSLQPVCWSVAEKTWKRLSLSLSLSRSRLSTLPDSAKDRLWKTMTHSLNTWANERTKQRTNELLCESVNTCTNKWMEKKQMNEWMNGQINKWMNH